MIELLSLAIEAHGGLERWQRVGALEVNASITGAIWFVKGCADVLKNVTFTADTKRQRLTMSFPGQDKRTVFEPTRVILTDTGGHLIETRDNPATAFEGQTQETPWDALHVAYFSGEALWTYLNVPFLYAQSGFQAEEIEPITVDGETWRRLKVTFPDSVRSHTRTQISCFGRDGLLRRHDYTVDVLGGAQALNYATDYRNIEGLMIPTARRVVAYEGDYQPIREPVLVDIRLREVKLLQA